MTMPSYDLMPERTLPTRPPSWFVPKRQELIYRFDAGHRAVYRVDDVYILKQTPHYIETINVEATTHRFVADNTDIPVPKIYAEWLSSPSGSQHYLLQQHMPGQTLTQCWAQLSVEARVRIATQVASHMDALSRFASSRMQALDGHPLRNNAFPSPANQSLFYLPRCSSTSEVWERVFQRDLTRAGVPRRVLRRVRAAMPPCTGQFVFTHGDLYVGNVMVDARGRGRVTAIIDWESAGFWPAWFQYARLARGCGPEGVVEKDREWKWILSRVMQDRVPHGEHGRVWLECVHRLSERPESRTALAWLGLVEAYLEGKVGIWRLREYRDLER
jgi:aminoglycoside phosphotransferase